MIKEYYYNDSLYRRLLKKKKKDKRLKFEYSKIKRYKRLIKFVYLKSPKGTGDAVL